MSLDALVELIHTPGIQEWRRRAEAAHAALFGAPDGRYPQDAQREIMLRAPEIRDGVTFAAWIHHSNPTSGPYGGLSFVVFPNETGPALIGLVVGTAGLAPDEAILGRPGHARKAQAICAWLNGRHRGDFRAWAKQDPTRIDVDVPEEARRALSAHREAFKQYGRYIYAFYAPTDDRQITRDAAAAFLDLLFRERGYEPLKAAREDAERIRKEWLRELLPAVSREQIAELLRRNRYVILQGPPGTGKTRMARLLLKEEYKGIGRSIQFHPNTSYENFIGGLAPEATTDHLGFRFKPAPGVLMEAAREALEREDENYFLHIDEINRADLAKVLGEAIFLLETDPETEREIELPYDFGPPFHRRLRLPRNLHILGTMNSADRSIALVDIAIRRRFAFLNLWPRPEVVEQHGSQVAQEAFRRLLEIFTEHASEEAFNLMPGHAYFLEPDKAGTPDSLRVRLAPLLEEYLAQGYVTGFAEHVRAYLQWLKSL